MQRLASFADAETALAVREMRVAARERALETKLNNTVAGHMDNMVAAQGDKREKLRRAQARGRRRRGRTTEAEGRAQGPNHKGASGPGAENSEAKKRVAVAERKLIEKEFARKPADGPECEGDGGLPGNATREGRAREGQVASREEAIDRRGEAVEQLVREARASDIDVPKEAAASPVPDRNVPVAELTGVVERVRKMAGALDGATGADPSEEAGAVAAAAKETRASARLASRPYAARRLPDRHVDDALDAVEDDSARKQSDNSGKSLSSRGHVGRGASEGKSAGLRRCIPWREGGPPASPTSSTRGSTRSARCCRGIGLLRYYRRQTPATSERNTRVGV